MTPERARQILENGKYGSLPYAYPRSFEVDGGPINPLGITEAENEEIKQRWDTMSGQTTYYDALLTFLKARG